MSGRAFTAVWRSRPGPDRSLLSTRCSHAVSSCLPSLLSSAVWPRAAAFAQRKEPSSVHPLLVFVFVGNHMNNIHHLLWVTHVWVSSASTRSSIERSRKPIPNRCISIEPVRFHQLGFLMWTTSLRSFQFSGKDGCAYPNVIRTMECSLRWVVKVYKYTLFELFSNLRSGVFTMRSAQSSSSVDKTCRLPPSPSAR